MGLAGRSFSILTTSVAIGALMTGAAFAQEADQNSGFTLLQRLVLGAGQAKVATDTPQAVSVIEQEDIDREQATTIGELLDRVPNAQTIGGSDRVLGQALNIRGIGKGESAADEGRVIVNVDGVPQFFEQYRMGGLFNDPELFKRVEVLRGPASSTLYGSGALGGVVNFTTKDASDFIEDGDRGALKLKANYDTNAQGYLLSGILALRMSDNAEFLLAGNYRAAQNFTDGDGVEAFGSEFATPNGLAKGTFYLDENRERIVRVSYSQFTSDEDDQNYQQLSGGQFFGTIDRVVNNRQAQIAYQDEALDNPWLDLNVSLSYNNISNEQTNASSSGSPLFQDSNYQYETFQLLADNTFEWRGDTWENYLTIGGQIVHQNRKTGTVIPLGFHPEGQDFQVGLFAQSEFIWNDRLTLIPGVRVDYQKLTPDDASVGASEQDDIAISPKIAALYEFNDHVSVFGSYAHTQRFPTLDEMFSNDFAPPASPNYSLGLTKETSNNFELGFVLSGTDLVLPDDAFDLKTTVFYNRVDDLIVRQRRNYPQYVNIGEAELYGVEVEAAYDAEQVFATLGFGYTVGNDLTNDTAITTVAPPEISAGLGYRLPDHGLTFGWDGRFVFEETRVPISPRARDVAAEELRRAGFSTHDLYVNWKPEDDHRFAGWEAGLRVENVFNETYRDFLSNDNGKGRTFKLTLARTIGF